MEYNDYNKPTHKKYFHFPFKNKQKNRRNTLNFAGKKQAQDEVVLAQSKKAQESSFLSLIKKNPFISFLLNEFFATKDYIEEDKTFELSYENLTDKLDKIPSKEKDRYDFLLDFFELDAKDIQDDELKTGEYIATLAQYSDDDLKTMLEFYIECKKTYKDSTFNIDINTLMPYKPYMCKNVLKRGTLDIVKNRHQMFPDENYVKLSDLHYLASLSDGNYEKTSNLIEQIYMKNNSVSLLTLINFTTKTPQDTINYMLENDLFNIENISGFTWSKIRKDREKLFFHFGGLKKETVEKLHKRGLLKDIPERKGHYFDFSDVKRLVYELDDKTWEEKVEKRNLLTVKTAKDTPLNYSVIIDMANLTDEEFEKVQSRQLFSKVGYFTGNIAKLAKISDEDWQKILDRGIDVGNIDFSLKTNDVLSRLLSISDEDWQIAQKRGLTFANADDYSMLELDENSWNNIIKRKLNEKNPHGKQNYDTQSQIKLAHLTDEEYENVQKRGLIKDVSYSEPVFSDESEFLSKLTDEEYHLYVERGIKFFSTTLEVKKKLFEMNDEKFAKFSDEILPLLKKYEVVDRYSYYELADFDEDKYEIAKQLLEIGYIECDQFYIDEIKKVAEYEPEKIERLKKISSEFRFNKDSILKLLEYDTEEYEQIINSCGCFTSFQYNRFIAEGIMLDICNSDEFIANRNLISKINSSETFDYDVKYELTNLLLGINKDYSVMTLRQKNRLINILQDVSTQDIFSEEEKEALDIDGKILKIQESIRKVINPVEVSREQIFDMMRGFFANNNPKLHSLLSNADFAQYKKDGLPLLYPRSEFLKDLNNILNNVDNNTKTKILNKLQITPKEDKNGNITGYDGIIDLTKLNQDGIEKDVFSVANKFIKENKIITGDKELDNALNSLISGIPEFINAIGKKQHKTHDFTLDIHMLTVLKEALNNPEYKNLSNKEKFCLKFAIILHDIAKSEGTLDSGHENLSALYVRDILNKSSISLMPEMKDRIYEMVKNHHWLANYNRGFATAEETAVLFRRDGDLKIARIMSEADLKGVSEDKRFYERFKDSLDYPMQQPIQEALDKINAHGQIFLTNKCTNSSKIPRIYYKGNTYKVIDFTKLPDDFDLFEYGFEKGATVDNFRLFVHAVNEKNILSDLENVYNLSDVSNQGFLCASYVSVKEHPTYFNCRFGVSLEAENVNIANASPYNQGSGGGKNFGDFNDILTNSDVISSSRKMIPHVIKNTLGINTEEYIELYKIIQKYRHISQFDEIEFITIGDKTFSGKQIKDAIQNACDGMIEYSNIGYNRHNEANILNPKTNAVIAKVKSMDEIPKELLDFALRHDLPIYILGD